MENHNWPAPEEHVWSPWMTKTGLPKATQWRGCVHPECHETEERPAPLA